jgi:alkylation response protein AidB-like acyl-CoA dehydrogenase
VNETLTEQEVLLRETVREFGEAEVAPVAEELGRESRFPYEMVARLRELGLMGMPVPEELGGGGLDTLSYAIGAYEE